MMERERDVLRLSFTVRNDGSRPLLVTDNLVSRRAEQPTMVVVQDDVEPNTVAFRRGYVDTNVKSYLPMAVPSVVQVAPGSEITRTALVPLPLIAAHNEDPGVRPLRANNTHAVLEVGWIDTPEPAFQRQAIGENTFIQTAARWVAQRWLRGERLPLPNVN